MNLKEESITPSLNEKRLREVLPMKKGFDNLCIHFLASALISLKSKKRLKKEFN